MAEEKLLIRLRGAIAEMLDELVRRGYFSTKAEAVRAGILRLGQEYGLIRHAAEYWRELRVELERTGKKMNHREISEALERLEEA